MRKTEFILMAAIAALFSTTALPAQTLIGEAKDWTLGRNGFHIYDVSGSVGYSSFAGSFGNAGQLGGSTIGWASVSTGYSVARSKYQLSILYAPNYSGTYSFANLNSLNQNATLDFRRRLSAKWSFFLGGTLADTTVEQFILGMNPLANHFSGLGTGQPFSTTALGVSNPLAPARFDVALFGTRLFTFGANTGASYRSARLTVSFSASETQTTARFDETQPRTAILPRAHSERADAHISYALNTRTEVASEVSVSRILGYNGPYTLSMSGFSVGRRLKERWYASVGGGIGRIDALAATGAIPSGTSWAANSSVGYRGRTHSFAATIFRTVGDASGSASASTSSMLASWTWRAPLSPWSVFAFGGKQRLIGGPLGDVTIWQASAGVSRALSRTTSASFSYANLTDNILPVSVTNNLHAHAMRFSISWVPLPRGAGRGTVTARPAGQ